MVIEKTKYGFLAAPDDKPYLIEHALMEDHEKMYRFNDIKGKTVADIGAFLGETSLIFISQGASRVYAIEPILYDALVATIRANGMEDRIIPIKKAIWYDSNKIRLNFNNMSSGGNIGDIEVETITLGEFIIEYKPNLVKMDCEGCECSIIATHRDILSIPQEWIIEIHGFPAMILYKMIKSGFKYRLVEKRDLVYLYHFYRE